MDDGSRGAEATIMVFDEVTIGLGVL